MFFDDLDVLIIKALWQGRPTAEITSVMPMSESGIKKRIARIKRRLGVHTRHGIIIKLIQMGSIEIKPKHAPAGGSPFIQ